MYKHVCSFAVRLSFVTTQKTCSRKNLYKNDNLLEAGERPAYKTEQIAIGKNRNMIEMQHNAGRCHYPDYLPRWPKPIIIAIKTLESAPSETSPTPALSDLLSKVFPIYVLQPTPRGIIYCYVDYVQTFLFTHDRQSNQDVWVSIRYAIVLE